MALKGPFQPRPFHDSVAVVNPWWLGQVHLLVVISVKSEGRGLESSCDLCTSCEAALECEEPVSGRGAP